MKSINLYCDIFTVSLLLLLGIYHSAVYAGRLKTKKDKSFLFFSVFVFSLCGYILTRRMCKLMQLENFVVVIEALFASVALYSISLFFHYILSIVYHNFIRKTINILLIFGFIMASSSLLTGINWYLHYLFSFVVLLYLIALLVISFPPFWNIVKQKKMHQQYIKILFAGFFLLLLYLVTVKFILSVDSSKLLARNHLFAGIIALLFSYVLAQKSNKDLEEILKEVKLPTNSMSISIPQEKASEFSLTPREKEVIQYVSTGLEYKEIADRLNISTRTVIRHTQNIFAKAGVHNKVEMLNKLSVKN